ncbi:MAG: GH3 auxin-responsive promoter family protein [Phycisphaerae bacterium]
MPSILERIGARLAIVHATRVYRKFRRALDDVQQSQNEALRRALVRVRGGDWAKRHRLHNVRSIDDMRTAVPIQTYEDLRPTIERVAAGDIHALFSRDVDVLMFATSSGTMSQPKWIPVTKAFVDDYRRGWNTFGVKVLADHPAAILRPILQSTGRMDAERSASGLPVGAITGLLAQTQKSIVRRFYVGGPEIAAIDDPAMRQYALMRMAIERDVAFAITANPATLIELAKCVNRRAEVMIRDVRDGTLSHVSDGGSLALRRAKPLKPNPGLATRLEALLEAHGALRPRDYWSMTFLACWTGGSMGQYLNRLSDWYGPIPVRDIGLLASEGRVSIPVADGSAAGPLDIATSLFEFIPVESAHAANPPTLRPQELEVGTEAIVVLTNTAGLVRYRLDDVVRVTGRIGATPMVEFLHRAGGVSSIAGEKLTEQQVVAAVRAACSALQIPEFDYLLCPMWGDPPCYRLSVEFSASEALLEALDRALGAQNEEYESRRKTLRLNRLESQSWPAGAISALDAMLRRERGATAEQYKRTSLLLSPGADDAMFARISQDRPNSPPT